MTVGEVSSAIGWTVVFVAVLALVIGSYLLACRAIWRYVGRSEKGTARVVWTVLAAAALAIAYGFFVGIVVGLVIVFLDRKSTASAAA